MSNKQQDLFEPSLYLQSGRDGYFSLAAKPYRFNESPQLDLFNGSAVRKNNEFFERNWTQSFYRVNELAWAVDNIDQTKDSYISQAVFRKKSRRAVNVDHCGLLFVDLDTYHIPNIQRMSQPEQIRNIIGYIEYSGIPTPSLILFSGRGFQVKWTLATPVPQQALTRWNAVQKVLVNKLSDIGADQGARDISRVLRLDQTVNTKTGEIARVVYYTGNEYQFDDFADNILPIKRDILKKREMIKLVKSGGKTDFNFQSLAWARLSDLRRLRMLRGGAEDGFRSNHLFYEINFLMLADITHRSNMWKEARTLHAEIDPQWKKTTSGLSTVYKKAQEMTAGEWVEYKGRKYPPLYTPKSSTLIDIFQIESAEMIHMSSIIDTAEKYRRNNEKRTKARREAGSVSRKKYEGIASERKEKAKQLHIEGMSQRQIAGVLGVSVGSVNGYLK